MTIPALRLQIGRALGFGSWLVPWGGTVAEYSALSVDDKTRLDSAMMAYIVVHPGEFTAQQVTNATAWNNPGAFDPYTTADTLGDFFGEVGNQAADLNQTLNPFSERNRGYVLGAVALGLLIYFAGPPIIAALKKAPKK